MITHGSQYRRLSWRAHLGFVVVALVVLPLYAQTETTESTGPATTEKNELSAVGPEEGGAPSKAYERNGDPDAPRRDEYETLKQAKEVYAKRIADIEQAASKMIEEALQKARRKSHEIKENESKASRPALLAAYDSAIQGAIENGDLEVASDLTA